MPTERTEQVQDRIDEVAEAVLEGWYQSSWVRKRAKDWGITPQTVRTYKRMWGDDLAAEAAETGDDARRQMLLERVRKSGRETQASGRATDAAHLNLEARIEGFGQDSKVSVEVQHTEDDIVETVALLLRSDAETREAVTAALAADGWVLTLERGG